jgi:hypothetical protein
MKKCGKENCEEHDCELCANGEQAATEAPCDICSVIGNGCQCQYGDGL